MYKLRLPYKLDDINMIGCFKVLFFSKKEHFKARLRLQKNEDLS